jgi:hypothetical protein
MRDGRIEGGLQHKLTVEAAPRLRPEARGRTASRYPAARARGSCAGAVWFTGNPLNQVEEAWL